VQGLDLNQRPSGYEPTIKDYEEQCLRVVSQYDYVRNYGNRRNDVPPGFLMIPQVTALLDSSY
jgi:hypothetical protein